MPHQSDSSDQKCAEAYLLKELAKELGIDELPERNLTVGKATVKVDGYFEGEDRIVIGEAWAHLGPAKGSQSAKIKADMLKFALIRAHFSNAKLHLVFACENARKTTLGPCSWAMAAVKTFGIDVKVFDLPDDLKREVQSAQDRQATGNRKKD